MLFKIFSNLLVNFNFNCMKNSKNKLFKQAFSLIEVSIVIVIIGILIVGIIKGKDLYIAAKASTAKNLTTNSHIVRIKSLSAWYESSANDFGLGDKLKDEASIETWSDISPFGKGLSRGATAISCQKDGSNSNGCIYREDGLANIPAISFSNDANFTGDTNFSASNDYTMLLVFSLKNMATNQRIIKIGDISINYIAASESDTSKLLIASATTVDLTTTVSSAELSDFTSKCQSVTDSFLCAVVISKKYTSATDTATNFSKIYVNNTKNYLLSDKVLPTFTGKSKLFIAGPKNISVEGSIPAVSSFSGNIAEIALFNDSFTQKEIDKLMKEYIAKKYSVSIKE